MRSKLLISSFGLCTLFAGCGKQQTIEPQSTAVTASSASTTTAPADASAATLKKTDFLGEAKAEAEKKNFGKALELADSAVRDGGGADAFYLRAQLQSQTGDFAASSVSLEEALKAGLKNPETVKNDPQLAGLRRSEQYASLVAKYAVLRTERASAKSTRSSSGDTVVRAGNVSIRLPAD